MLDPDTWVFAGLEPRGPAGGRSGIEAVSFVLEAPERRALCLVRPPGHHARPARGWASASTPTSPWPRRKPSPASTLNRVLIVDFDVHHGNGTQESSTTPTASDSCRSIAIRSIPGPVRRTRPARARASATRMNIPCPTARRGREYHAAFRAGLEKLADRIRPELVLISAGFDAHAEDPVGDLGLEVEDFEILTREIVAVAETHAQGRIVSVLEGGYNVPILAGCVAAHLHALGAEPGRG